jgi:hypothetical protein
MIRFHKSAQDGWLTKTIVPPMLVRGSAASTKFICAARISRNRIVDRFTVFEPD